MRQGEWPKTVVVVTHPHLGDVVNTTPVGGWLRRSWPWVRLVALTSPVGRELLEATGDFDEVLLRPDSPVDQIRTLFRLRSLRPSVAVFTYSQRTLIRLAAWAGVKERWVVQGDRPSPLATLEVAPLGPEPEVPGSLARLLQAAGVKTPSLAPVVRPPADLATEAAAFAARVDAHGLGIVAMHTGSSHPAKRWPRRHWAELAKLVEATSHPIVWIGGPEESENVAGLGGVDTCGKWPVLGTAAILAQCQCLVTGDSGPMHLAAGVGCRVVGLFGPTDSARFKPYGEGHVLFQGECPGGCGGLEGCRGECMVGLQPAAVLRAVLG